MNKKLTIDVELFNKLLFTNEVLKNKLYNNTLLYAFYNSLNSNYRMDQEDITSELLVNLICFADENNYLRKQLINFYKTDIRPIVIPKDSLLITETEKYKKKFLFINFIRTDLLDTSLINFRIQYSKDFKTIFFKLHFKGKGFCIYF